jgi:hypothetical protein
VWGYHFDWKTGGGRRSFREESGDRSQESGAVVRVEFGGRVQIEGDERRKVGTGVLQVFELIYPTEFKSINSQIRLDNIKRQFQMIAPAVVHDLRVKQ